MEKEISKMIVDRSVVHLITLFLYLFNYTYICFTDCIEFEHYLNLFENY